MRVLVVGGGGREHALAWKIASSPKVDAVLAAPGSDAIAAFATCFPEIKATDFDALIELARTERIGLVVGHYLNCFPSLSDEHHWKIGAPPCTRSLA